MGLVADAALAHGASVIGILPDFLADRELAHQGLTELRIVPSMHARKSEMAERADGFVALPGGFGTLEELFEVVTWGQLGLHAKPCGVLNVAGFYDPLLAFLDGAVRQQFIKRVHRDLVVSAGSAGVLLDRLSAHRPRATTPKWIDTAET